MTATPEPQRIKQTKARPLSEEGQIFDFEELCRELFGYDAARSATALRIVESADALASRRALRDRIPREDAWAAVFDRSLLRKELDGVRDAPRRAAKALIHSVNDLYTLRHAEHEAHIARVNALTDAVDEPLLDLAQLSAALDGPPGKRRHTARRVVAALCELASVRANALGTTPELEQKTMFSSIRLTKDFVSDSQARRNAADRVTHQLGLFEVECHVDDPPSKEGAELLTHAHRMFDELHHERGDSCKYIEELIAEDTDEHVIFTGLNLRSEMRQRDRARAYAAMVGVVAAKMLVDLRVEVRIGSMEEAWRGVFDRDLLRRDLDANHERSVAARNFERVIEHLKALRAIAIGLRPALKPNEVVRWKRLAGRVLAHLRERLDDAALRRGSRSSN